MEKSAKAADQRRPMARVAMDNTITLTNTISNSQVSPRITTNTDNARLSDRCRPASLNVYFLFFFSILHSVSPTLKIFITCTDGAIEWSLVEK